MTLHNVSDGDKITKEDGSSMIGEPSVTTEEKCSESCEAVLNCFAAYFEHNTQQYTVICYFYGSEADLDAEMQSGDTRTTMIKKKFTKTVVTALCKFYFLLLIESCS